MAYFNADNVTLFTSNNHVRYNDGIRSDKNNFGALRGFSIVPRGLGVFEVTIHVLNEQLNNWGEYVQMAPKQMRIDRSTLHSNIVAMRGFGYDIFGSPFSDYGIKIYLDDDDEILKIALIMYDRNVVIEYLAD